MSPTVEYKSHSFFGPISWLNFIDWLITLCLGAILILCTMRLGGVRPDTQADLLPLLSVALGLHGLWVATHGKSVCALSPAPFLFVPFAAWACLSVMINSPVAWRGSQQLVLIAAGFIFFWVALNNLRTVAHLVTLIFCALVPLTQSSFKSFYQYFQSKSSLASAGVDYVLQLHPGYAGRSTGSFADPDSFAAYTLILLPCFIIAAAVPRLPIVLRVFSFYVAVIAVFGLCFSQAIWAVPTVAILVAIIPFFCFKDLSQRFYGAGGMLFGVLSVFVGMYLTSPKFKDVVAQALTSESVGDRLILWKDAFSLWWASPIFGQGAGAYAYTMEQSNPSTLSFVPLVPRNDFLMVLVEYGLIGTFLLIAPVGFLLFKSKKAFAAQVFSRQVRGGKSWRKMPIQKFLLSFGICGTLAYLLTAFLSFPSSVPAILLTGIVFLAISSKYIFKLSLTLPSFRMAGLLYFLGTAVAGILFAILGSQRLDSQALELRASEELGSIVAQQIPIAGDPEVLDGVIQLYEDAVLADPRNGDAWIGLSAAICQTHYSDPADFEATSARALVAAQSAYKESPDYWRVHAQLGVAYALGGNLRAADSAFARAVELAPRSSNANFYYAAFLSKIEPTGKRASLFVQRALEIDPEHRAARQLQNQLLVL